VVLVDGAAGAVDRLRAAGKRIGLVTNQSAIGLGLARRDQVDACHRRLEELVGPFDVVAVCPHRPDAGCWCRKPRPGLVLEAAGRLGVAPAACVVIGDIGSDIAAARYAGAASVLVPSASTRQDEIDAAPVVASTVAEAVSIVLRGEPEA
jgi:histidinol-phosphate phosphatase family protein